MNSLETNLENSETSKSNIDDSHSQTCKNMLTRITNGIIICAVAVITLFMRSSGSLMASHATSQRGFFCDDLSLKYPIRPETVSTKVLISASFLGGLGFFALVEYFVIRAKNFSTWSTMGIFCCNSGKKLQIPAWIGPALKLILMCFTGSMANSILTDIGKHVIGWPRPNFIATCQPNVTCNAANKHEYITQFRCSNLTSEDELEDSLRSFPSAHASFAAFIAFFLVIYIHERFKTFLYSQRCLWRPFLQLIILSIYWWSALTRVSDYVHHPVDVLAGLSLGTLVALWTWPHMVDCLNEIDQKHKSLKFSIT